MSALSRAKVHAKIANLAVRWALNLLFRGSRALFEIKTSTPCAMVQSSPRGFRDGGQVKR